MPRSESSSYDKMEASDSDEDFAHKDVVRRAVRSKAKVQ